MAEEKKYTVEQMKQELLRRAYEAETAEDAQKYFEAYARQEALEMQAEKDAADYDCRREQNKNNLKGMILAALLGGLATGVCNLIGKSVEGSMGHKTALDVEKQREAYGLTFQKNHFKALKEDDLVVRMNDENFKPR
jgi:hypothetical protein